MIKPDMRPAPLQLILHFKKENSIKRMTLKYENPIPLKETKNPLLRTIFTELLNLASKDN